MKEGRVKKKLAFVLPRLHMGGAERVFLTFVNHVDRQKFVPVIIILCQGFAKQEEEARSLIKDDVEVIALKASKTILSLTELFRVLKRLKPDVLLSTMVHVNTPIMFLKPFFPKMKFFLREANLPKELIKLEKWKGQLYKLAYRYLYPKADLVLSPAQRIIDEFSDLGVQIDNHQLIYNPVDEIKIRQEIALADYAPDGSKTLKFIIAGRLDHEKGIDRLLDAMRDFHGSYPWQIEIWGRGPKEAEILNQIQRLELQDHIKVCGFSPRIWSKVAQSDYLLLPSRFEGMPNIALESLSCGTPVLAMHEAGGIKEIQNYAAPGAVEVFESMENFVEHMQTLSPRKPQNDSLLPKAFALDTVMKELESVF